jgi:hypothetical protein
MPLPAPGSPTLIAAVILICAASVSALRAADTAPAIARPAVSASVTVKDDGTMFILDNGIVEVRINRVNADLERRGRHARAVAATRGFPGPAFVGVICRGDCFSATRRASKR